MIHSSLVFTVLHRQTEDWFRFSFCLVSSFGLNVASHHYDLSNLIFFIFLDQQSSIHPTPSIIIIEIRQSVCAHHFDSISRPSIYITKLHFTSSLSIPDGLTSTKRDHDTSRIFHIRLEGVGCRMFCFGDGRSTTCVTNIPFCGLNWNVY